MRAFLLSYNDPEFLKSFGLSIVKYIDNLDILSMRYDILILFSSDYENTDYYNNVLLKAIEFKKPILLVEDDIVPSILNNYDYFKSGCESQDILKAIKEIKLYYNLR
jgi:hypothetical protein